MSSKPQFQQWLQQLECTQLFTTNDLLNGTTINFILSKISKQPIKELNVSNSLINRVSNWNILIDQLRQLNIILSQQNKTKIINGNQDIVIDIISQLKQFHIKKNKQSTYLSQSHHQIIVQVDITQIDPKKPIQQSTSLLQMLLILLIKNFNLTSKQAVALLSNQGKYLAHILTKGLKGQFKPIQNLLIDINKYTNKIVQYCHNQDNIIFFLRSIKPALISKQSKVTEYCLGFFKGFLNGFNDNNKSNTDNNNDIHKNNSTNINKHQIFQTHLLATYLLSIKRHPFLEVSILLSIYQIYYPSSLHSFLPTILSSLPNKSQSSSLFLSICKLFIQQLNKSQQLFQLSGFKQQLLLIIKNIKKQQYCIIGLNIVIVVYEQIKEYFQDDNVIEELIESINSVIMSNQVDKILFYQQLFTILEIFGKDKHTIAPTIFKILIQTLKKCQNQDIYQLLIKNFINIIKTFPSIPYPMILQTILSKQKQQSFEFTQIQLQFFFILFQTQPITINMNIKTALIIYDTVSKIFMQSLYLSGNTIMIMVKIYQLFKQQTVVEQLTMKMIKVCLAIHYANFKKLSIKRKSLTGNHKLTNQQALLKIKNNAIEFFIMKIALLKNQYFNNKIQPLIVFNYITMKDKHQFIKEFKKIITIFGNVDQLVEKYQKQIKMAEQQAKLKEKQEEKHNNNTKQTNNKSRYHHNQQQNTNKSYYQDDRQQHPNLLNQITRKKNSSSLHRSIHLGVTNSAQKGIQKYQKVYLDKIQKQDFQKIKKIQQDEKLQNLKKIYRKKMLSQGIQIKGLTNQIQYLYEFDSQQNVYLERNMAKLPFYTKQTQQQRDLNAVQKLLKSYQKALKFIYSIYAGPKKGISPQNFDELAQKNQYISSSGLYKFLKDFSFEDYITLKQVQTLTQKINIVKNQNAVDFQILDFEGFVQFFKQVSFLMFTRPPKDLRGQPLSSMLQQTFSNLKLFASDNKINQQIFQDPTNIFFNQTQAVSELNKKLSKNPEYILPQGYKKIVDTKITFEYKIFLQAMSPTYKVVFETLDQILFNMFNFHIMQPFTKTQKITRARPSLFVAQRLKIDSMPAQHIPVRFKKQIAKMPIKSRLQAKQVAIVLNQIIQAIQLGHTSIGQKHLNTGELQKKKQKQQQRKQNIIQKQRRQSRNRQVKTALQQFKNIKTQKQKQQSVKKKQQQKKIKQQKQKKQKQKQQLQKKIQEYNKKRKEQQLEKEKKKKQQEEKQKKQRERLKQINDQNKKKIQEEKKKKQEEEKKKKEEKQKEQKRLKQIEKKKLAESQSMKKKMIEQYKMKRSGIRQSHNITKQLQSKNLQNTNNNAAQDENQ